MHEGILRRQSARESSARTYARALPIVPVRARGLTIEGADGRRYLDCLSGAGTLALGHNHPVVLEAIRKVLDSGAPLSVLDLATPVKDAFITELFRTLPPGLADRARVQFCGPAGTDAVEAALKLVRAATGRTGILAFASAYHGMTMPAPWPPPAAPPTSRSPVCPTRRTTAAPSASVARPAPNSPPAGPSPSSTTPSPAYRCPAGMILEPVQGEGGVIPGPDAWLRRMRQITADRSVPLVADEIQTGVGRTGAFWAVGHSGITPDVMVLSKAIGGSLPLAVIVYRDDLDVWEPGAHAGTFRGNQLAMAAGTATLAHVRENGLAARAADLGSRMLAQLAQLSRQFTCVAEVRGRGLMIGVELVHPDGAAPTHPGHALAPGAHAPTPGDDALTPGGAAPTPGGPESVPGDPAPVGLGPARVPCPAAPELAAAVQRECLQRGLIVELGGRHSAVVRLLPPLTISDEQAAAVLDRLADAVAAVARQHEEYGLHRPSRHGQTPGPARRVG
ncbi:aminotransferase class III-fold pyridoxal phosphate-dependent enzyme [Streptomyces lasalocidi]